MARLPQPGSDENKWGDILNEYLGQSHNSDGSLNAAAVNAALDGDLQAIAALSATDNDVLQRKNGAWTTRTPAEVKTDLALTGTDVTFAAGGAISATNLQTAIRQVSSGAERSIDPAVRRYRAEAARARTGGPMTMTVWLGDSLTEGYSVTKRGFMWTQYLSRRLNGPRAMRAEYLPTSAGVLAWIGDSFWPAGQSPWEYSNANQHIVGYGLDMHAVEIAAGGFLELPYFGDVVNVVYARTPAAPVGGCPVTIDGVSAGTLSANGSVLPSRDAVFGTIGDYGAHTLRISVPSGTLTVEGAVVFDGTVWGFGQAFGTIGVTPAGHAGFSATHFADNGYPYWPTGVAARRPSLVGIELGANDAVQSTPRTPEQFRGDLITIMNKIDAAVDSIGGIRPGYLLVQMPLAPASYVPAAWEACDAVDAERCAVLDLRTRLGSDDWDVLVDGALVADGHPGNSGQVWIADAIASAIDTSDSRAPVTPPEGVIIEAVTPPTVRSAWPESFTAVADSAAPTTYDASTTGATVGERRHRIWLDAGTYQARATLSRGNDRGQCQILIGHSSAGIADCYQVSADVNVFTLGSTVTIDTPGWYPVTIRKLATKNAASSDFGIRFHRLHLRKI